MKKLILLRHAKSDRSVLRSSNGFLSDFERPLSKRGREACKNISEEFSLLRLQIDLVEYSTAKRAVETFHLIKDSISTRAKKENPKLYTFDWKRLMCAISQTSKEVNDFLLVGHNPAIEDLINQLVSSEHKSRDMQTIRSKYPTGAFAILELNIWDWTKIRENCGTLTKFVRPIDINMPDSE